VTTTEVVSCNVVISTADRRLLTPIPETPHSSAPCDFSSPAIRDSVALVGGWSTRQGQEGGGISAGAYANRAI
jgi:hypothetical protein